MGEKLKKSKNYAHNRGFLTCSRPRTEKFRAQCKFWLKFTILRVFRQNACWNTICPFVCSGFLLIHNILAWRNLGTQRNKEL